MLSTKNVKILKHLTDKLTPRWEGPFEVLQCINKGEHTVAVKLQTPDDWSVHPVFSTNLIKPFRTRTGTVIPPLVTQLCPK
jgi:hypothetical protein